MVWLDWVSMLIKKADKEGAEIQSGLLFSLIKPDKISKINPKVIEIIPNDL
ncbi:hypothetical protein [Paenibacillus amylolyticus]|uniref:hypothetical protein n=1 Tax=Paenibacillus amylolyticus TaxID=1451 RepID=UPI0013E355DB|nr:hypothetical protein [Paenibacillus amylolyticus]